jgi:predicted metal-dependent phosphoesterase TrpH
MEIMKRQNRVGRADLHIHTCYSDGRPSVRAVLDHVAHRTALQVIAITDHDTIDGALAAKDLQREYPFEIIVGEEVTSREGHILALFISRRVPPRLSAAETIAAIHEQGGIAIAAHPFITAFGEPVQGVGKKFASLPFDGVEVENSTPFMYWANFRARRHNRQVVRMPEVGNSDAHIVEAIGKSYTRFAGSTAADLRRALCQGQTTAHASNYGSRELLAYLAFWIESLLPTRSLKASQ